MQFLFFFLRQHICIVQDDDNPSLGVPIDVRDQLGMCALHWLAVEGHSACVQWLIGEVGAEVDCPDLLYKQTPLHFAASKMQVGVAQELLALKADPKAKDKYGYTPLHTAARAGASEVAQVLLEAMGDGAANIDGPDGQTPLHRAAYWGQTELVTLLLRHGATRGKLDARGRQAADIACDGGDRRDELPKLMRLLRTNEGLERADRSS